MGRRPERHSSPSPHLCERPAYQRGPDADPVQPLPSQNLPAVRTQSSGNVHASDVLTHAKYPGGKDDTGMPSGDSVWNAFACSARHGGRHRAVSSAVRTGEGIKMKSRIRNMARCVSAAAVLVALTACG